MSETRIGSVSVRAELHDTDLESVTGLHDVVSRYQHLENEFKEHCYAVYLNGANETLAEKLIGLGNAQQATVDIADIVRTAILVNARAVILVHNHPSGQVEPTPNDTKLTEAIRDGLDLFDIHLLDHVIIGRDTHHSMRKTRDVQFTGGEA